MTKRKKEQNDPVNEVKDFEESKAPSESPELSAGGRVIKKLQAHLPEVRIIYSDLVRVAMDRQGMTQLQFGINDPYDRESGMINEIIYLSPRGTSILLKLLIHHYKDLIENSPSLAQELSMPQMRDLFEEPLL